MSFLFENCTLKGIDLWGIYLENTVKVKVRNCVFSLADDVRCVAGAGCAIYITEYVHLSLNSSLFSLLFYPTYTLV